MVCEQCKIEFAPIDSRRRFCCMACSARFNGLRRDKSGTFQKCPICEEQVYVWRHEIGKLRVKTCSKTCYKIWIKDNPPTLGFKMSEETKKKISKANTGNPSMSGKKHSEDTRGKMSGALLRAHHEGRHPAYRGGITPINMAIRTSFQYKLWREAVFKRDNWTCVQCGTGGMRQNPIQADHIKQFAYFPELRFEVSNGRTLCRGCHMKTDTWGNKSRWAKAL